MTLNGIDVSSHQPATVTVDVKDYDFAIVKATGGTGYVNPKCNQQFEGALASGKLVGLYHFARERGSASSARAEADYFVDNIQGHLKHGPVLVLDWEADAANSLPISWAREWLDRVRERTGVKPWFYSYASYVQNSDMSSIIAGDYGLWIASYGASRLTSFSQAPAAPASPWPTVAAFQFSESGRLAGYAGNLDLNVFYGGRKAWAAYAAKNGKPVTPPPAVKPPAPAPAPAGKVYVVKPGDALSVIAERHGVTTAALAAANGISDPNRIYPGQRLAIPSGGAAARRYTVQRGDTLSGIGARFGVPWRSIQAANGIGNPDQIYAGQVLVIP